MDTMKANLSGHEDDGSTFVYMVDYPPSRTQSRSIHARTVRLRKDGGGSCTCQSAPQTGLFCVHILISEEQHSMRRSDVSGSTARAPSQATIDTDLKERLKQHIHPCWHTSTWKTTLVNVIVHQPELQGLEKERLLPPLLSNKTSKPKGRCWRKRYASAGEARSSNSNRPRSSRDTSILSTSEDSSCSDVDNDSA